MKRITLRVPDHQHAALARLLTLERRERGNRYSLNDLCTRLLMVQLSHGGASLPRAGEPAPLGDGTMHIPRMPPPPPVPMPRVHGTSDLTLPGWQRQPREEPQPERSAKPAEPEPIVEQWEKVVAADPEAGHWPDDPHAEELMEAQIERAEGEGMPDGHLDH